MRSRFAFLRVRPAHRDEVRAHAREVEWVIIEWPRAEARPTKYWLSALQADAPRDQLVRLARLRWRIARDYEELKQDVGIDHFEGCGWRGFHHHGVSCIAPMPSWLPSALAFPLSLSPSWAPLATGRLQGAGLSRSEPNGTCPNPSPRSERCASGPYYDACLACGAETSQPATRGNTFVTQ
jgi:hypothetical protein